MASIPVWYRPILASYSLNGLDSIISYQFCDGALLLEALNTGPHKELAQLGDAALDYCLVLEGRKRHQLRGPINDVLSLKASNANLARLGFTKGLDKYIVNNPGQGTHVSEKVMATTMEAILGAVCLDSGHNMSEVAKVMGDLGICWPETD